VPPVDNAAVQPRVPEPLAVAVAGEFTNGAPFSVPEQVPEPLKL
jgi:hypothetical protein